MAEIGTSVHKAIEILTRGGLVAIPTETVYGLAANALDPIAVAKIFEVKQRPYFDPLIIHTYAVDKAAEYVIDIHPILRKLADQFLPGPLTLLLPKRSIIPDLVTSGLERVAVRIPDHPLTLQLLRELDFPLAAPSANPFGYISPTTAEHVNKQLGDELEYILDGGPCDVGLESTIIGIEEDGPVVYRLGGLALDDIEKTIGKVRLDLNQSSDPTAPGQLKSHYAPRKNVILGDLNILKEQFRNQKKGILCFGKSGINFGNSIVKDLSEKGDLREAAAHLFSYLRELDESEAEIILVDLVPSEGLGIAINDRLLRASTKDQ